MATTENKIKIEHIDFITVPSRDIKRTRQFYVDVLGMQHNLESGEFELFGTENLTFSPWEPEADGLPFEPNRAGVALQVDDVPESKKSLEQAGIQFFGDIKDTGVCHMAFFEDPDGNVLVLHNRYGSFG